jgi:hypothetical protein
VAFKAQSPILVWCLVYRNDSSMLRDWAHNIFCPLLCCGRVEVASMAV